MINNYIDDEGAAVIAAALPNTQLKSLLLNNNFIGDKGAANFIRFKHQCFQ